MEGLGVAAQSPMVVTQTEIFNIFIGIVQHRMEMAAQVGELIVNGRKPLLQHTTYLSGGVGGSIGGVGFDEINDGFRLGQIQLAVEEGPLGKLAPAGRLCSCQIQMLQACGQDSRRAVAVKLHSIFAGIAVGCPADYHHTLIDGAAILVLKGGHTQLALRRLQKRCAVCKSHDLVGNGNTVITGEPQNADGADYVAGGYSSNGMGHKLSSLFL